MKIFQKFLQLMIIICFFSCSNESKEIPNQEVRQKPLHDISLCNYYSNLKWKEKLSEADISTIHTAIGLTPPHWCEDLNLIVPLLVHREYSILDKDTLFSKENYRHCFSKTKNLSDKEFDEFLLNEIKLDTLTNHNQYTSTHQGTSYNGHLLSVLRTRMCKQLRNGFNPNVTLSNNLVDTTSNLFRYSKLPNSEAIDQLIEELLIAKDGIALHTLRTYGKEATHKILKILKDTTNFRLIEDHGKKAVLLHLMSKAQIDLSNSELNNLIAFINKKEIYEGVLNKYLWEIGMFTHQVTNEDLELCHNRIGLYYDKETNKKIR